MGSPRVTVVIPTWNRAGLLRRALTNLFEQTLPADQMEVVVADNASDDHTGEVARSFESRGVAYHRHPHNIGLYGNLNYGLTVGSAPFIAYLLDDDLYYPDNLRAKLDFFDAHPEVGSVYARVDRALLDGTVIDRDLVFGGGPSGPVESGAAYIRRTMDSLALTPFAATIVRREAVGDERFRPEEGPLADVGFRLRMALRSSFGFVDETLSVETKHADAASSREGIEHGGRPELLQVPGIGMIEGCWGIKRRFLSEHRSQLEDPDALLAAARAARQRQLRNYLLATVRLDPRPRTVATTVREVGRHDAGALVSVASLRAVARRVSRARSARAGAGRVPADRE
jgi:hypothetical protein